MVLWLMLQHFSFIAPMLLRHTMCMLIHALTILGRSQRYNWTVTDAVRKGVDGIHGGPDVVTIVLLETTLRGDFSSVSLHSTEMELNVPELTIHWTEIIPEFPTWTSMLLILIMLTVVMTIYKRRLLKAPIY